MSELSLSELLLSWVVSYGAPMFGLALLIAGLGVPIPATFFVLAAGAFTRQGVLDGVLSVTLGLSGVVIGDSLSFGLGRFARNWVDRRFNGTAVWNKARESFLKSGGVAVFLTRFLLTPLAIPTNLIAGGSGYAYVHFLTYDVLGEAMWIGGYGVVGYLVGSQWELISQVISDFSGLLVGLVLLGGAVYAYIKRH